MSLLCKRYELRGRNVMSRQVGVMILPAAKIVGRGAEIAFSRRRRLKNGNTGCSPTKEKGRHIEDAGPYKESGDR